MTGAAHRPTRRGDPLGLLIGVDDGLLQGVPGAPPARGIDGPRITLVDARGGYAVAAGSEGVWLHAARRWRQVWSGDVRAAQIGGQLGHETLYVGTADGRLLCSSNDGESWTEIGGTTDLWRHGGGLSGALRATATGSSPAVTGVAEIVGGLAVAFDGGGAWFTPNGGGTWLRRDEGIDPRVHRLYRHPDITERLYVTTASGLYRSTDQGHTWLQSLKDLDRSWGGNLAVLPGPTDTLVLSLARATPTSEGAAGALFRSVNAGLTWSRVLLSGSHGEEDEWERVPAVVSPHEWDDVAFVAAGDGVFASHDRGRTWTSLGAGLPPANALAVSV